MIWLELSLASGAISAICGSVLAINKIFPAETHRFLRFVSAEIGAFAGPAKPGRKSLETIARLEIEVDMQWWDKQFDKLKKVTAPPVKTAMLTYTDEMANMHASTLAELEYLEKRMVSSVSQGSITYHYDKWDSDVHGGMTKQQWETYEHIREGLLRRAPKLPGWKAGQAAKKIARAASTVERDTAWREADQMVAVARLTLPSGSSRISSQAKPVETKCPDCAYQEMRVYGDENVRSHKTELCMAHIIEETKAETEKIRSEVLQSIAGAHASGVLTQLEAAEMVETWSKDLT